MIHEEVMSFHLITLFFSKIFCSFQCTRLYIFGQFYFKKYFIYLILERGKERERDREKHQCVVAPPMPPTGDLAGNPNTCPDWESNLCFTGWSSVHWATPARVLFGQFYTWVFYSFCWYKWNRFLNFTFAFLIIIVWK